MEKIILETKNEIVNTERYKRKSSKHFIKAPQCYDIRTLALLYLRTWTNVVLEFLLKCDTLSVLLINIKQWPSGLRRGSAADSLLGLQVRIPPGAWIFVF